MATELDQLLNSMKEQEKKKEKEKQQFRHVQGAFISEFKQALDRTINPAMLKILSKLRGNDCYGLCISRRREKSNSLSHIKGFTEPPTEEKDKMLYRHYDNYYVSAYPLVQGISFIITILGNYYLQEIYIFTEYLKHNENAPATSLKKTKEQFTLAQLTPEFLETMVAEKMKEMIGLKQQADEKTPPVQS